MSFEAELSPPTPRPPRRNGDFETELTRRDGRAASRRRRSELGVSALSGLFRNQAAAPRIAAQTYTDVAVRRFRLWILIVLVVGFVLMYVGATATPRSRTRTMAGACAGGACVFAVARDNRFASGGEYGIVRHDRHGHLHALRSGHGYGCVRGATPKPCRVVCDDGRWANFAVPSWPGAAAARSAARSFRSDWTTNATSAEAQIRYTESPSGVFFSRRRADDGVDAGTACRRRGANS